MDKFPVQNFIFFKFQLNVHGHTKKYLHISLPHSTRKLKLCMIHIYGNIFTKMPLYLRHLKNQNGNILQSNKSYIRICKFVRYNKNDDIVQTIARFISQNVANIIIKNPHSVKCQLFIVYIYILRPNKSIF